VLPAVTLVRRRGTLGAAVAGLPVVVPVVSAAVGVAGALAVGGQALQRGADLLPVAAAAELVAAGLGTEQLGGRRLTRLPPGGRLGPPGAVAGGVAPARAVLPGLLGGAGLVVGERLAGGWAGRARGGR